MGKFLNALGKAAESVKDSMDIKKAKMETWSNRRLADTIKNANGILGMGSMALPGVHIATNILKKRGHNNDDIVHRRLLPDDREALKAKEEELADLLEKIRSKKKAAALEKARLKEEAAALKETRLKEEAIVSAQGSCSEDENVEPLAAQDALDAPPVRAISTGYEYTMAIAEDGSLWGWGCNGAGQLGDGTTTDRTAPVQIQAGTKWAYVSARTIHTMAIREDGSLWGWGRNKDGQLDDGTTTQHDPIQIIIPVVEQEIVHKSIAVDEKQEP